MKKFLIIFFSVIWGSLLILIGIIVLPNVKAFEHERVLFITRYILPECKIPLPNSLSLEFNDSYSLEEAKDFVLLIQDSHPDIQIIPENRLVFPTNVDGTTVESQNKIFIEVDFPANKYEKYKDILSREYSGHIEKVYSVRGLCPPKGFDY